MNDKSKRRKSALEVKKKRRNTKHAVTYLQNFALKQVFLKTTMSKNVVSSELLGKDLLKLT